LDQSQGNSTIHAKVVLSKKPHSKQQLMSSDV
jgi:hypothetical protein